MNANVLVLFFSCLQTLPFVPCSQFFSLSGDETKDRETVAKRLKERKDAIDDYLTQRKKFYKDCGLADEGPLLSKFVEEYSEVFKKITTFFDNNVTNLKYCDLQNTGVMLSEVSYQEYRNLESQLEVAVFQKEFELLRFLYRMDIVDEV